MENTNEITLNKYAEQALKKGYKFKYFTTYNEKKWSWSWDKKLQEVYIKNTYFGFTADGNIWFWFKNNSQPNLFSRDLTHFQHRYNGATGKYISTIKQKWNAKYILGIQDWK